MTPPPASLSAALSIAMATHCRARSPSILKSTNTSSTAIWRRSWLFAGPSIQAPLPGDFFRFDLGDDSVIVGRGHRGELIALHNTCRHRGMPVCEGEFGHVERWVCPYHQWSYELDGSLRTCGGMNDQLQRADYGLAWAGESRGRGVW